MSYVTAYQRWAGVGPYYAMFPLNFVDEVVQKYTKPGQKVLDPFAGRASSIFASSASGRPAVGIEINPAGWLYGATKLHPANPEDVVSRACEVARLAHSSTAEMKGNLSEFFHLCFAENTLKFLLTCRALLDWRHNVVDRTLMTFILIDLHGRRDKSFSNQMSQSKAMSPNYSVAWWQQNKLFPPDVEPIAFLTKKVRWRYAKGTPEVADSVVLLGDSSELLQNLQQCPENPVSGPYNLLFTSPPYMGITDYHRDQWLRLWMLGGDASAARSHEEYKTAFASLETYHKLLSSVFHQAADMMSSDGYVYVRTDARSATFDVTRAVLRDAFPRWREEVIDQPYYRPTQTARFGDLSRKPGEKDIILMGPSA